jgi:hypothetical protein
MILEPYPGRMPADETARVALLAEIRQLAVTTPLTERIVDFRFHPSLPVDIRHNAKIFREKLAAWAARQK